MRRVYKEDKSRKFPIYFFVQGDEYKFWNLFQSDIHFFGVKEAEERFFYSDQINWEEMYSPGFSMDHEFPYLSAW